VKLDRVQRIVFYADGTWQAPLNNTNVYSLYKAWAVADDQITFYDDGVGADITGPIRILDKATAQFATLPAEVALDIIRETWTPADGPPRLRPVAAAAEVANSVAVPLQDALAYVPGSLTVSDGQLADGYSIQSIVSENAF
jgi:Uncharacterized alpha/beta hydrolase domain (DUF2235)